MPITKVALVEPAVQQGFIFHHAEPGYVQLCRWLPSTPSKLPANASHQVLSKSHHLAHCVTCPVLHAAPCPGSRRSERHVGRNIIIVADLSSHAAAEWTAAQGQSSVFPLLGRWAWAASC